MGRTGKRGLALSSAVLVASVALALIPAVPAWSGQPERLGAVPQQATLLRAAPALLERVPCVLELRGGDGVHLPIVAWSQRQETLTLKIDVPVGVTCSADNVKVEEQAVRWHEEKVGLDLELWGKLDVSSAIVRSDGYVHTSSSSLKTRLSLPISRLPRTHLACPCPTQVPEMWTKQYWVRGVGLGSGLTLSCGVQRARRDSDGEESDGGVVGQGVKWPEVSQCENRLGFVEGRR